jgi:hypothetical protein
VSGWLEIDENGAAVLDEGSRKRLASHAYALAPSPPALLVGLERGRVGAGAGKVILAGDLGRIAFSEIVSLVVQTRASGVLRIAGESATRTVIFDEGEVRGASSERIGERLGEIAVRMGLLKYEQMEELRDETDNGRRAGRLAVERGLFSERALWNAVQEHVITIFQAILIESRGSFLLSDETVEDAVTVPGLSAEGLLMECVRRLDEMRGVASRGTGRAPENVVKAFNGAFRDIFATAKDAGAGDALRTAAVSMFEDDPSHARLFRDIAFSRQGELPARSLIAQAQALAGESDASAADLLADALSTVMLFLLFVAGEHLEPGVHSALHSRVKSLVARG